MRAYLTTLAFLLSLNANSQSFSLMPFGGIGSSAIKTSNSLKNDQHARTFWEAGMDVQYSFSKHCSVISGIEWVSTAYRLGDLIFVNQFNPLTGTYTNLPIHFDYRFSYLRIPLEIRYDRPLNKKLSIGLQGGIAGSWLVYTKITTNSYTVEPEYYSQYKHFSLWMVAGINANYRINKGLGVTAMPSYGYILTPSGTIHAQQFQTLGVRLGLNITL